MQTLEASKTVLEVATGRGLSASFCKSLTKCHARSPGSSCLGGLFGSCRQGRVHKQSDSVPEPESVSSGARTEAGTKARPYLYQETKANPYSNVCIESMASGLGLLRSDLLPVPASFSTGPR